MRDRTIFAPRALLAISDIFGLASHSGNLGIAQDFINGGISVKNITDTILTHSTHTELARTLTNDQGGLLLVNHLADLWRNAKVLKDALSALVAGIVAGLTAASVIEAAIADLIASH